MGKTKYLKEFGEHFKDRSYFSISRKLIVIITTRKIRTGLRSVLGRNVLIRHIKRSMFFGYEPKRIRNLFLPVSDVEKTLIDFVYFKLNIPDDVLDEITKKLDINKLNIYLKRTDERLIKKVNRLLNYQAGRKAKK